MGMMSISLQKLERFIQDLTNYSRNRRLALELETIHVKELAENTLKLVAPLNASDFKLQLIDLQEVPLISDRRRLDIVFNNLISNAIKYRNQDPNIESQLTITWKVSPEEAILIFSDNGKGIADKHVHKVFQMFYRAHPELPGTGIGLFIVAETIRFLGGTITVDSEENVGTTFTISLPNHSKSRTED
jgi:signal transduction histidine kinase